MAQGWEQMSPLCPVEALFREWRGGEDRAMFGGWGVGMRISTHTNVSETPQWAHIDSQTLWEGLALWQRLKEDVCDTHTTHTSNKFCSSEKAAGGLDVHLYFQLQKPIPLPSLLPIREVLLLSQWLNPSIPVIASQGMLLVETAGGLFRHTAQSLSCSNATPLWGQRKLALTCTCLFWQYVINNTLRYFSFYVEFKHTSCWCYYFLRLRYKGWWETC